MIPYTIERRPDTGVTNITMGVWLLVASEAMLFGALLSSYALLRATGAAWSAHADAPGLPAGLVDTGLMGAAVACAWLARRAPSTPRWQLAGGALAAMGFLLVQAAEYAALTGRGLRPATDTWCAAYFTITGVHAVHVLGGAAANLWTMTGARRVGEPLTRARAGALTVYWNFVALLWLIVFALFYLT